MTASTMSSRDRRGVKPQRAWARVQSGIRRSERRADDAVVVLAEPRLGVLAVDLAGGRGEQDRAVPGGGVDDVLSAVDVGAQALERAVADDERADRGG